MIEADSVHSTPRRFTPKSVAGADFASEVTANSTDQPKRRSLITIAA
jgi:hypothetical protein